MQAAMGQEISKEFYIQTHKKQEERAIGIGLGFWNLRAHSQWHTSSDKTPPPNSLLIAPQLVTKHANIWAYESQSYSNQHKIRRCDLVEGGVSLDLEVLIDDYPP